LLQKVRFTEQLSARLCYSTYVRTGDHLYPCSTFVPMAKSATRFNVKNPETGKTWKLQELYNEREFWMSEAEFYKKEFEDLKSENSEKILTMDDYATDFVKRCEIHGYEFNLFLEDLQKAIEFFETNLRKVKKVELPSFLN